MRLATDAARAVRGITELAVKPTVPSEKVLKANRVSLR
jgi:hypothetical protein